MKTATAVSYIRQEIEGCLPSGWRLLGDAGGSWDTGRATWTVQVRDPAANAWDIEVKGAEAAALGRIDALRQAVDRVYREALG